MATDGQEAEAAGLVAGIEIGDLADEAGRLRTLVGLRKAPHDDRALAAADIPNEDAEARYRLGEVLAARGDYPRASTCS